MTIKDRVLNTIKARRERLIKGEINCIPLPFERFRTEWPGIEQGMYYLISGASKSSKTQLANYLFVYNTVLFAFKHRDIVSPKIYYYNLEETDEAITLRFMSFLLYSIDKIRISPTDLKSTDSNKPVHEDIINLLESPKYKEILDFYEEVVEFKQSRNPTGVYKDVKAYAEEHGVTYKKKYTYKDELGITREGDAFDYYTPTNPNEYFFIIVDHVSLLETERGLTLRESINKLSEYLIIFRNRYNYIPVVIQQQGLSQICVNQCYIKLRPQKHVKLGKSRDRQPLSKHSRNIMKEQRLVDTFLTSGVEEDELPRVRALFLCIPILSGII